MSRTTLTAADDRRDRATETPDERASADAFLNDMLTALNGVSLTPSGDADLPQEAVLPDTVQGTLGVIIPVE